MLVLSRKRSQKIRIGSDIVIEVIRTGRTTVQIGIAAPDDVRVLRDELVDPDLEFLPVEDARTKPTGVRREHMPTSRPLGMTIETRC